MLDILWRRVTYPWTSTSNVGIPTSGDEIECGSIIYNDYGLAVSWPYLTFPSMNELFKVRRLSSKGGLSTSRDFHLDPIITSFESDVCSACFLSYQPRLLFSSKRESLFSRLKQQRTIMQMLVVEFLSFVFLLTQREHKKYHSHYPVIRELTFN